MEEAAVEAVEDALGQIVKVPFVLRLSAQPGGPFDDPAIAIEVGGTHQRPRRRPGVAAVGADRRRIDPIAVSAKVHCRIGLEIRPLVIQDETLHHLVVVAQRSIVAVEVVVPVGNDRGDTGPDDVFRIERPIRRQNLLQAAVVGLMDAVVVQEVVVEAGDVERPAFTFRSLGGMAGPGHAFVAIGFHGYAAVLQPRAPAGVLVGTRDDGIGTRELADPLMIRVGDETGEVVRASASRQSLRPAPSAWHCHETAGAIPRCPGPAACRRRCSGRCGR